MTWATQRKLIIGIIASLILLAGASVLLIATFYKTPSCVDGVENQDETGIDCGGSCPYLCTSEQAAPTVLFTKTIDNGTGRVDIVASIENKNLMAAARRVPYRVKIYGPSQQILREVSGTVDLPPGTTQPVFIPGVASSREGVSGAFLEIDPTAPRWYALASDTRVVPLVSNTRFAGTSDTPKVEVTLFNPTVGELSEFAVVVFIHDSDGTVIGASSTIVPSLVSRGKAIARFTWNGPFKGTPALVEALPVIPLPPL